MAAGAAPGAGAGSSACAKRSDTGPGEVRPGGPHVKQRARIRSRRRPPHLARPKHAPRRTRRLSHGWFTSRLPSSPVIRLRHSIEPGLRHPLLGPLLLIFLGLILAFVVLHTVEHGVEGVLFSCVIIAALSPRLVIVLGRTWRAATDQLPLRGRAPPRRALRVLPPSRLPPVLAALPLRL